MVAFYNQQDQDIYTGGQHYIPQQYYRLNYTPPEVMGPSPDLSATNVIPPYPLPNQGGGGGGGLGSLGGRFGNLDESDVKWVDENGWGSCGTDVGKKRAHQIANREKLSRATIARVAAFKRHQQHKDVPYSEGCGGLMWDAWGGT